MYREKNMILALVIVVVLTVTMAFSGIHESALTTSYETESVCILNPTCTADITHSTDWDDFTCGGVYYPSLQGEIDFDGHTYAWSDISYSLGNTSETHYNQACFVGPGESEAVTILTHSLHHYNANDSGTAYLKTGWN